MAFGSEQPICGQMLLVKTPNVHIIRSDSARATPEIVPMYGARAAARVNARVSRTSAKEMANGEVQGRSS
jgi:hypothetical protein